MSGVGGVRDRSLLFESSHVLEHCLTMRFHCLEVLFLVLGLTAAAEAQSPIQITEFAAAGGQGLRDEEGDTPDWIELRMSSKQPLNLQGWTLSEESRRAKTWTFPSTNLASASNS